jgi:hypothetical protein
MEKVHFYFDEAGEKGFLEGDFSPEVFGLIAGVALPTRNVSIMNEELQDIFKDLDCTDVNKIHATEIFKNGGNQKIKDRFFSYMAAKEEWLLVYEAMYPKGYINFNSKLTQNNSTENKRYKPSNNPKRERLYNHLLEGVIVKLDEICKTENSTDLLMMTDRIDKQLLKEALNELNYLKQEEHIHTTSAYDTVENKVVFRALTSRVEGFDVTVKNIHTIEIEDTPSYMTLAADIMTNSLYRHLTFKILNRTSIRLHSNHAVEGFELQSRIALTDDNYIMDSLYCPTPNG